MTIDEAIAHCLEVAEKKERDSAELIDILDELDVDACKECAADHRQLAEWLTGYKELEAKHWDECRQIAHYDNELKEAKRLLRQAIKDINVLLSENDTCYYCKNYVAGECLCVNDCNRTCEWHCIDDALKLLGGSENG